MSGHVMTPLDLEWVGAQYTWPRLVREGDNDLYPKVVMWLELPTDYLLVLRIADPRKKTPFVETLMEAMAKPPDGLPRRRPSRIRVQDETLADAVRSAIGKEVKVVVGAVPEADAVFSELLEYDDDRE